MSPSEAKEDFQRVDAVTQAKILVKLAHMITIASRDSYEVGTDGVKNPLNLRRNNEVMHRVIGQIGALLKGDEKRFPDEVILGIIDGIQGGSGEALLARAVSYVEAKNEQSEQAIAPNRSLPHSKKSMSPVRGPED